MSKYGLNKYALAPFEGNQQERLLKQEWFNQISYLENSGVGLTLARTGVPIWVVC